MVGSTREKQESWSLKANMALRKRSRPETTSATAEALTTRIGIDETHAVQLARHLAELYKRRRFTDLKVHDRPCFPKRRDFVRWAPSVTWI